MAEREIERERERERGELTLDFVTILRVQCGFSVYKQETS